VLLPLAPLLPPSAVALLLPLLLATTAAETPQSPSVHVWVLTIYDRIMRGLRPTSAVCWARASVKARDTDDERVRVRERRHEYDVL
jgi:hypothetical protein